MTWLKAARSEAIISNEVAGVKVVSNVVSICDWPLGLSDQARKQTAASRFWFGFDGFFYYDGRCRCGSIIPELHFVQPRIQTIERN
jgi:hypothetical protein